jgi:GTPase SAR1 family protein
MVLSIVGNKIDLESQRQVTEDEAQQYASSIGGSYFESSAVKDEGEILFKIAVADRLCSSNIVLYLQYESLISHNDES